MWFMQPLSFVVYDHTDKHVALDQCTSKKTKSDKKIDQD